MEQRCLVVSEVALAEFRHFHESLVKDIGAMMRGYITRQVEYHSKVCLASCTCFLRSKPTHTMLTEISTKGSQLLTNVFFLRLFLNICRRQNCGVVCLWLFDSPEPAKMVDVCIGRSFCCKRAF